MGNINKKKHQFDKSPLLSIITPTLNNEDQLIQFFNCIKKQSLSERLIEHIVVDGGSTDKTLFIARSYKARILHNKEVLAEPGIALGVRHAKGKFIMVLASDNYFYDSFALEKMISVFKNNKIAAAFPKHESRANYSIFSKYINTFTDPFNHFVYGYASNARTYHKIYKELLHTDNYVVYDFFSSRTRPLLALAQGFMVRKKYIIKRSNVYDDLLPILALIENNLLIAYVFSVCVYHPTVKNIYHFIKKQRWATKNALQKKPYGISARKYTLSNVQKFRMIIWPVYSPSFIFPLIYGIIEFIRTREYLWLFHPVICFLSFYASSIELLSIMLNHKSFSRY